MERGIYQHPERGRQLIRFDGFRDVTPTDFDAVIEYRKRLWIVFEVKMAGKDVPLGQRLALERLIQDAQRLKKHGLALIVEHETYDTREDIILADCAVRSVYTSEDTYWRPPDRRITAKEAADAYIAYYGG